LPPGSHAIEALTRVKRTAFNAYPLDRLAIAEELQRTKDTTYFEAIVGRSLPVGKCRWLGGSWFKVLPSLPTLCLFITRFYAADVRLG
jgi:hypothetical protein